jgi:hypothetical protein
MITIGPGDLAAEVSCSKLVTMTVLPPVPPFVLWRRC